MKKVFLVIPFMISAITALSQVQMRAVDELINKTDPGWELVRGWIGSAKNRVDILPCDTANARTALYETQVTTRSPMGAIIYSTGGLLVDHGWIRILGSGNPKLGRTLPGWNKGKSFKEYGERSAFLLIADDAIGGFFALNGGLFGKDAGKVYYFAPDNLEWEPMNFTYTEFLNFCFNGNLDGYYKGLRWASWKEDVSKLNGDEVYNFYPPIWTKEGKDIDKTSRKVISADEQFSFNMSMRKKLGMDKNGY